MIITLCGSTRFKDEYMAVQKELTLEGHIVISVGCFGHSDNDPRIMASKEMLDRLHFEKIDMADAIFVVNPGGYVGSSTSREIEYARSKNMKIMWLETPEGEKQKGAASGQKDGCVFCSPEVTGRNVAEHGLVLAINDKFPVTDGHLLIIPKRHVDNYFEMTPQERRDADILLQKLKEEMVADDPSIKGFNHGTNTGLVAGQTVMHAHIHLIPRRDGDSHQPRGGVRGVIEDKKDY